MIYQPGNLLKEYTKNNVTEKTNLVGMFLIISITNAGVHTITVYDSDGFWNPGGNTFFPHSDLKNRGSWVWKVQ